MEFRWKCDDLREVIENEEIGSSVDRAELADERINNPISTSKIRKVVQTNYFMEF